VQRSGYPDHVQLALIGPSSHAYTPRIEFANRV
jgi:hypothetical protein